MPVGRRLKPATTARNWSLAVLALSSTAVLLLVLPPTEKPADTPARQPDGRVQGADPSGADLRVADATAFAVSGSTDGVLAPGLARPVDLRLENPTPSTVAVTSLEVRVESVSAPEARADRPCTPADFEVEQYSGPTALVLPGGTSTSLGSLGVPVRGWPRVGMRNTSGNQDGCKGASLTLAFSALAQTVDA